MSRRHETVREAWQLECPACKSDEEIVIAISCWARLFVNGTEEFGDHEWDQASACRCGDCGYEAIVAKFTMSDEVQP